MIINTNVDIDVTDLAIGLDSAEAQKVIKIIDREQSDTAFTLDMTEWFIEDLLKYDEDGTFKNKLLQILCK